MRLKLITWLTLKATAMSSFLLRRRNWNYTAADFRAMPKNSLGNQLIQFLDEQKIEFNPKLVRHDAKHVLLGYKMEMPDELKIHAFLIGNRSSNPMATIYLLLCLLIVPEMISKLRKDFIRGKKSFRLKKIDLKYYLESDLNQLKALWQI